ncbi:MAG: hypothetical protein ACJ0RQ_13980 [Candidatus Azotimanducaceae bacterium]
MRRKLIQLHLYVAAFFLPMLVAMAVSGGLYLTGNKGSTARTPIEITAPQGFIGVLTDPRSRRARLLKSESNRS